MAARGKATGDWHKSHDFKEFKMWELCLTKSAKQWRRSYRGTTQMSMDLCLTRLTDNWGKNRNNWLSTLLTLWEYVPRNDLSEQTTLSSYVRQGGPSENMAWTALLKSVMRWEGRMNDNLCFMNVPFQFLCIVGYGLRTATVWSGLKLSGTNEIFLFLMWPSFHSISSFCSD